MLSKKRSSHSNLKDYHLIEPPKLHGSSMSGGEQNEHWLTLFPPGINEKNLNSSWILVPVCNHVHANNEYAYVYCVVYALTCVHTSTLSMQMGEGYVHMSMHHVHMHGAGTAFSEPK